jgi:hypothetical protein
MSLTTNNGSTSNWLSHSKEDPISSLCPANKCLDQQICNADASTGHYHCRSASPCTFNLQSNVFSPFTVNVSFDLETKRTRRILNKRSLFDVQRKLCKPKLRRGFFRLFLPEFDSVYYAPTSCEFESMCTSGFIYFVFSYFFRIWIEHIRF